MQRKDITHLDAELLSARLKPSSSRRKRGLDEQKKKIQYLRKHAIADVWLPSDVRPPVRQEVAAKNKPRLKAAYKGVESVALKNTHGSGLNQKKVTEQAVKNSNKPIEAEKISVKTKGKQSDIPIIPVRGSSLINKNITNRRNDVNSPLSSQFSEKTSSKSKKNRIINFALLGMAGLVFLLGIAAVLHSFMVDKQIQSTNKVSAQSSARPRTGEDVDESKPSTGELGNYSVAPDLPKLITIPSQNVHARVRQAGVDKDGALQAPYNVHDVAWYKDSVKPGSPGGASIIDGHISGPTQRGAFYNLNKLSAGDEIKIERGDGSVVKYKVVSSEILQTESVDMAKMFMPVVPGKHGLNLISCTGKYNSEKKEYEQRVMVYAEVVNE